MEQATRKTDVIMLKKAMIDKDYKTISSLATDAGIDRTTLGKVLSGKIQPSSDIMYKLCDTLELDPPFAGQIFFAPDLRSA